MKSSRLYAILLVLVLVSSPFWVAHLVWRFSPWKTARVRLVDYSVPFVSAREHRGAVWLLNHARYRAPGATRWAALHTHTTVASGASYRPNRLFSWRQLTWRTMGYGSRLHSRRCWPWVTTTAVSNPAGSPGSFGLRGAGV